MSMIKLNLGGYRSIPTEAGKKMKKSMSKLREVANDNVVDMISKKIPVTYNRKINRLAKQGKLNLFA